MSTMEAGTLLTRLEKQGPRLVSQWDPASRKGYLKTHAAFLSFFRSQPVIDRNTVILGASLVYSWMPTMLTLELDGVDRSAAILQKIRSGAQPSDADLARLKATINNSLVGASKVLHFVAPERMPIWDSRVCRFLGWPQSRIADIPAYQRYRALAVEIAGMVAFARLHAAVQAQLGRMSRLRTVELLMYLGGAPRG